jgi:hypothetical protein
MKHFSAVFLLLALGLGPAFAQSLAQGLASPPAPGATPGTPGLPHSYLLEPMRGLLNQANAPAPKPAPTPPKGQLQSYGNGIALPPPAVPPLPPQDQPYQ